MMLLIDAGNTRIKWQLRDAARILAQGYELTPETQVQLQRWQAEITHIAVSSVASSEVQDHIRHQLNELSPLSPVFYSARGAWGELRSSYRAPETMGADRWHAMVAAWHRHQQGVAVVDAGSALTVDYIGPDGQHLGGYILPGRRMCLASLRNDAARINYDLLDQQSAAPGTNTSECVNHGLHWLWQSLSARLAADCQQYNLTSVLVTGGDGQLLLGAGLAGCWCPDLVFDGLSLTANGSRL
ncbi:MAG: type III pantothenate kinase [Marinobacter sp.]|nr:type III pantothenate kinase [Marinobacter sp.]